MSQQQNFRKNEFTDSSDSSSDSSSVSAAPQIIRTNAVVGPSGFSYTERVPSVQDLAAYSPTQNIEDHYSESIHESYESELESIQESYESEQSEQEITTPEPTFPSFLTGLVIMVSLIAGMELPARPVTATFIGIIGLVYNYRRIIGTTNMRILAGVAIYTLCAAIWLMFEWQYQMQITPVMTSKTNMFNKFVFTHIQHIALWPLTITLNFIKRSAYPFLLYIGTNISNIYTSL